MTLAEPTVLLIGHADRSEFCDARDALAELGSLTAAADADSAATMLESGQLMPELIVVAQSIPGEFTHTSIDRLRRAAPLARILGLLGAWCEGEARTGKPWPAAVRVYWHQWVPRCHRNLQGMARGEPTAWGLPITATEEERLLLWANDPIESRQGLIAIHTPYYAMEDWLSDACRSRGFSTVWLRPPRPARVEGAAAVLFDGSDCRSDELAELQHLCQTLDGPPVVVLLDFPRIEDSCRAMVAGAAAVLSKPLRVDDLFWQLDRLLEGNESSH